jgi:type IV secretion system protein VirD4
MTRNFAFQNMLRAAARDPFWAVISLLVSPFAVVRYIVGLGFVIIVLLVGFGSQSVLQSAGVEKGDLSSMVANAAFTVFVFIFLFRLMTSPMIDHFGDIDDDTHGSLDVRNHGDHREARLTNAVRLLHEPRPACWSAA